MRSRVRVLVPCVRMLCACGFIRWGLPGGTTAGSGSPRRWPPVPLPLLSPPASFPSSTPIRAGIWEGGGRIRVIYKRQMTCCALCVHILLRHVRLGGFKLSAQSEDGTADAGRCGESAGRGGVAGRTLGIRTSMLHTCDIYTAYYNSRRHGLHSQ